MYPEVAMYDEWIPAKDACEWDIPNITKIIQVSWPDCVLHELVNDDNTGWDLFYHKNQYYADLTDEVGVTKESSPGSVYLQLIRGDGCGFTFDDTTREIVTLVMDYFKNEGEGGNE